MSTNRKQRSFQAQAEEHIREEAMTIARATQTPGQTKQQTKLISQGIAKGIAEYKRREKAKARQLDKARKRTQRQMAEAVDSSAQNRDIPPRRRPAPLIVGGAVFVVIAALHIARLIGPTPLLVGDFEVPVSWSAIAALVCGLLGGWLLIAARTPESER